MKPYFIKWIAQPGVIKPPCVVLETLTTGKKELFQIDEHEIDIKTQVLAKPFLCKREVKKGDTLVRIDGQKLRVPINANAEELRAAKLLIDGDIAFNRVGMIQLNPGDQFADFQEFDELDIVIEDGVTVLKTIKIKAYEA